MFDFVEPRVRRVVAEQLGVNIEELTPDVSLTDDLAADSLDLLELTLALETEFGVVVSESALERVRSSTSATRRMHAPAWHRSRRGRAWSRRAARRAARSSVWACSRPTPPR